MLNGVGPKAHPYSSNIGALYESDPRDMGYALVDGKNMPLSELWSPSFYAAERKSEDCDGLASWLAAWYRLQGVEARAVVYPSINFVKDGKRKIGRHVCTFVPYSGIPYKSARPPFGEWYKENGRGVIRAIDSSGYIEDPSIALGMYHYFRKETTPRVRFNERTDIVINKQNIVDSVPSIHYGDMFYGR
jgi:hypothetical protein